MLMRLTSAKVAILWKYCGTFGIWFSLMNASNGTKLCYDLQNITSVRSERATLDFWKCISFVTINLSISEGTCVIFLKALSAPICSNQFWVRPMQLPNVHFQNIQNENNNSVPGCWRLWRDTRHNETEAGRLRHWEERGLWLMLLQDTSEFIRDQDKRCLCYTCKDTSSGRVLALSFSFLYVSGFPLHSSAKRILISVSAELSASSACREELSLGTVWEKRVGSVEFPQNTRSLWKFQQPLPSISLAAEELPSNLPIVWTPFMLRWNQLNPRGAYFCPSLGN